MSSLGVIGGSGVYNITGIEVVAEHHVTTPFGEPSDVIVEARLGDKSSSFFLPRHGRGHRLNPSEVNYRANIFALKKLGVTKLLAISAVGSMQEHIHPGDFVVPEQIFDRTKGIRPSTFFEQGLVGHVTFASPFCKALSARVFKQAGLALATGKNVHQGGTYICMEGPQFSTRAESNFYRKTLDAHVIGMTALPEAKLAREAGICYAMAAMATDYDCWHDAEVSVDAILKVLRDNSAAAEKLMLGMMQEDLNDTCSCKTATQHAVITDKAHISKASQELLATLSR